MQNVGVGSKRQQDETPGISTETWVWRIVEKVVSSYNFTNLTWGEGAVLHFVQVSPGEVQKEQHSLIYPTASPALVNCCVCLLVKPLLFFCGIQSAPELVCAGLYCQLCLIFDSVSNNRHRYQNFYQTSCSRCFFLLLLLPFFFSETLYKSWFVFLMSFLFSFIIKRKQCPS